MHSFAAQRAFFRTTALLLSLFLLIFSLPFVFPFASALSEEDFTYEVSEDGASVTVTGYTASGLDVTVPDTIAGLPVKAIGSNAFDGMYSLTSITLPSGLETIASCAFRSCAGITAITIPTSVTRIAESAFYNCLKLADISIGRHTYDIGYQAFHNTAWYNQQPNGVVYLGRALYAYKGTMAADTELTVEPGTASVTAYALSGYAQLKAVYLPVGLRQIGAWAFMNCSGLVSVRIPATTTQIGVSAFENCPIVTIVGANDSYAQAYANENTLLFRRDTGLEFLIGDMNGDGVFSSIDLRILMQCCLNSDLILNQDYFMGCELNDDGLVNSADCRILLKRLVQPS